jgi:hypothetical protein
VKIAILALLALTAPAAVMADPLPLNFLESAGDTTSYAPGTVLGDACSSAICSNATVSAIYGSGEPILTATVSASSSSAPAVYVYDQVEFYFEITGPSGVVPIKLIASATSSYTGSPSSGELDAGIYDIGPNLLACSGYAEGGCGVSHFSGTYSAGNYATNEAYPVIFRITGQGGGNHSTGSITATLDPVIEIDPTWAGDHPGYSLTFSQSSAPEPSAWALMILGTGAIGAAMRGRRRTAGSARAGLRVRP